MRKILKYVAIFLTIIVVGYLAYVGLVIWAYNSTFEEFSKDVWSAKNQIILKEIYSPDSTKKVGLYNYDAGSFGYTTVCVSIVKSNEAYPIEPNVLQVADWTIDSLVWRSNQEVFLKVEPGYASNRKVGSVLSTFNLADTKITFEPVDK